MPSQAISKNHKWVVAATIPVPEPSAREGDRRGTVRLHKGVKIDVLETYCEQCRKPFSRVAGEDCEAAASREHLIGGPTGERKKRKDEDEAEGAEERADEFAAV